jgi:uncharacterized membrane protein YedE/YeeE
MSPVALGLIIGILFGAALYLGGLAEPDKIIGSLRLKDFHAFRTIAVFVLVGMLGTWILQLTGHAHLDVKPAAMLSVFIGGALLGVGFGITGYCPGTGLACAAAGRMDALITVLGMFVGALVYILLYPTAVVSLEQHFNYGKVTLPEVTNTSSTVWVLPIVIVGALILLITAPRKKS